MVTADYVSSCHQAPVDIELEVIIEPYAEPVEMREQPGKANTKHTCTECKQTLLTQLGVEIWPLLQL